MAVFTGNGAVGSPSFTFSSDTNTGFYRYGADQLSVVTAGTEAIRVDSAQNVGIGRGPSYKLDVDGQIRSVINESSSTAYSVCFNAFNSAATNGGSIQMALSGQNNTDGPRIVARKGIVSKNTYGLKISDASTLASSFTSTGEASIRFYYESAGGGAQAGNLIQFWTNQNGFAATTTTKRMTIGRTGTITFHAYGAGTLSTDASGNISASDGRYKTKTRDLEGGLDKILALQPTFYRWNESTQEFDHPFNTEHEELGFVAQEVAAVIPEASPGEDEEGVLRNYSDRAIIACLVDAIKELKAEIDALKG